MVYYEMMEKHTIRELVEAAGREYRDHAVLRYLVDGEITDLTFGEFARQSRSITAWVAEKSAEAGHPVRVAMMGPNSPLYVKLFMGIMCGGGVSMPMDPQMKEANICACLNKAEADIYIYDAAVTVDTDRIAREVPTLREVVKMETIEDIIQSYADRTDALEVSASDCAAIIFTSGTTGEEKGVMLSNGENVSPEQIEKLLLDHQIVKETLVYGEGNSIVAEIFPDSVYVKQYGITDIKAAIARVVEQVNAELPSHKKVMKHLIRVTPMQTTSSGKIVRSQRAGRDDVLPDDTQPLRLPESPVQQKLWDCISGVLNRKDFGIDTDLFALGMDSLSCITTLTAFAEELDFHLELDAMLKHRTVLQLEQAYISAAQTAKVDYAVRPVYPLINVQKYFAYLIRGNTTANVPVLLKLSPTVDLNRLADAAKKLFTVHPVLNNVVQMYENKGYANFRNDSRPVTIPVITLTPAASFQSAMVHGHERVSSKWCYIIGSAYSVITWIILILVTIPLANALC